MRWQIRWIRWGDMGMEMKIGGEVEEREKRDRGGGGGEDGGW